MNQKALLLSEKNEFYKDSYPKLLILLFLTTVSSLVLLIAVCVKIFLPSTASYYMVLKGNQNVSLTALNYPIISRSEILRWASQSVLTVYNFDFSNWEERIKEASNLFTIDGYSRFKDALKMGVLTEIIEKKLQVTAVVSNPPVITAEGYLGGRYTWKVSLPVLLTYISSSEVTQRRLVVNMLIARIPVTDSPRGYAIEQFYEE